MKMYQFKNLVSIICFIFSGFAMTMSVMCIVEWSDTLYAVLSGVVALLYLIVGICANIGVKEDYEDYQQTKELIVGSYNQLAKLHKQHYWTLDIDCLVPVLKNKKEVLKWAADISVACIAYQHDYKTEKRYPVFHRELDIMIDRARYIIENKNCL